jgi:hypothetical protein
MPTWAFKSSSLSGQCRFLLRHFPIAMLIDRQFIQPAQSPDYLSALGTLEVGQSVFCEEWRQAASLRSLSYYLIKTRKPGWKFTFRKMDRGWRLIRTA